MKQPVNNKSIVWRTLFLGCLFIAYPALAKLPFVPFPKEVQVKVVGEDIIVNGLPIMAYEFHARMSMDEVLGFYKETWQVSKRKSDADQPYLLTELPGWTVISRLENGHNITVQLAEDGIKGIRALVGVSPLPVYLETGYQSTTVYSIPQLGKAKVLSVVQSDDAGNKSETYWMDSAESIENSLQRYRKHYESKGYSVINKRLLEDNQKQASSAILIARGKRESIRMDAVDLDGKTRIVAVRGIR